MINNYSNYLSSDYDLTIYFYNISESFITRFNNVLKEESTDVIIKKISIVRSSCHGDLLFISEGFFEEYQLSDVRKSFKHITFIADKFSKKRFTELYENGVDNIIYFNFIDAEIRKMYTHIYQSIMDQVQKDLLNEIINRTTNTIVITDDEGEIEFVNQSFINSTGYSYEEVMGENPRIIKSELHPEDYYAELWEKISEDNTWQGDFINVAKNGEYIYEEAMITPIYFDSVKAKKYVKIANNITKQKYLENQTNVNILLAKDILYNISKTAIDNNHIAYEYYLEYSHELGGDMLRIETLGSGKYLMSLVDVTGHDLAASLIVMSIYSFVHQYTRDMSLNQLVSQINHMLCQTNKDEENLKFATGIFILIDVFNKELEYINAGHPAALKRDLGDHITQLDFNNMMLGLNEKMVFESTTIDLYSGDEILVFSDGILDEIDKDYKTAYTHLKERFNSANLGDFIESIQKKYKKRHRIIDDISIGYLQIK